MGVRMLGVTNVQVVDKETGKSFKLDRVNEIVFEEVDNNTHPISLSGTIGEITIEKIDVEKLKQIIVGNVLCIN